MVGEARQKVPGLNLCQTSNDGNEFLRLGWTLCQGLQIHAVKILHEDSRYTAQAFIILDVFLLFFYVNHFFDFMSLSIFVNNVVLFFFVGRSPDHNLQVHFIL